MFRQPRDLFSTASVCLFAYCCCVCLPYLTVINSKNIDDVEADLEVEFIADSSGRCPRGFYLVKSVDNDDGDSRSTCRRCSRCPPGHGAVRPCGRRLDTLCQPCVAGYTFSDTSSANQPCLDCTQCGRHADVQRNCTIHHNAVCNGCHRGYFLNTLTRDCEQCSYCYPDRPGLTFRLKECAVRRQPKDFQCLPVFNPPHPPPTPSRPTESSTISPAAAAAATSTVTSNWKTAIRHQRVLRMRSSSRSRKSSMKDRKNLKKPTGARRRLTTENMPTTLINDELITGSN